MVNRPDAALGVIARARVHPSARRSFRELASRVRAPAPRARRRLRSRTPTPASENASKKRERSSSKISHTPTSRTRTATRRHPPHSRAPRTRRDSPPLDASRIIFSRPRASRLFDATTRARRRVATQITLSPSSYSAMSDRKNERTRARPPRYVSPPPGTRASISLDAHAVAPRAPALDVPRRSPCSAPKCRSRARARPR